MAMSSEHPCPQLLPSRSPGRTGDRSWPCRPHRDHGEPRGAGLAANPLLLLLVGKNVCQVGTLLSP